MEKWNEDAEEDVTGCISRFTLIWVHLIGLRGPVAQVLFARFNKYAGKRDLGDVKCKVQPLIEVKGSEAL